MKGLNRINDYNFGPIFNLFEDVLGFGFGKDVAVVTGRGDSFLPALILFVFLHQKHIKFYRVILVKFEVAACFFHSWFTA
jgi:hypothetical protein